VNCPICGRIVSMSMLETKHAYCTGELCPVLQIATIYVLEN
jgi:endogenous inhibitor of DNA gyrase (YacG/DUF329 family)